MGQTCMEGNHGMSNEACRVFKKAAAGTFDLFVNKIFLMLFLWPGKINGCCSKASIEHV